MVNFQKSLDIVIAEDDENDYLLIAEALKKEGDVGFIHMGKRWWGTFKLSGYLWQAR